MSICPKCETPIPESAFGIYTCVECIAVLNISFDGRIEFNLPESSEPSSSTLSNQPQGLTAPTPLQAPQPISPAQWEPQETTPEQVEASAPTSQAFDFEIQSELAPIESLQKPIDATEQVEESGATADAYVGQPFSLEKTAAKTVSASASFQEVVNFANSEVSRGAAGPFLYDILIQGIDSEDLRAAVRDALTDKRFGWDTQAVMITMRGGSIKLEQVNAVKAGILVSRLKGHPLDIRWVQNGILEIEA